MVGEWVSHDANPSWVAPAFAFTGTGNLCPTESSACNTYSVLNKYFSNSWMFSLKSDVPVLIRDSGHWRRTGGWGVAGTSFFSSSQVWSCSLGWYRGCSHVSPVLPLLHLLSTLPSPIGAGARVALKSVSWALWEASQGRSAHASRSLIPRVCSWVGGARSACMSPDQCPGSHPRAPQVA